MGAFARVHLQTRWRLMLGTPEALFSLNFGARLPTQSLLGLCLSELDHKKVFTGQ